MKRLVLLMMILLLSACGYEQRTDEYGNTVSDKGQASKAEKEKPETVYLVKEANVYHEDGTDFKKITFDYSDEGKLTRKTETYYNHSYFDEHYDSNYPHIYAYEYNEDGNLIYCNDSIESFYEYDEKGNPVSTKVLSYEIHYTYNDLNQLIKEETVYEKGYTITVTFEYDDNGNMVRDIHAGYQMVYEYDENNNKIKSYVEFEDRNPELLFAYEYDNNGNMLTESSYASYAQRINKWQYDNNGNCIRHDYYHVYQDDISMEFDNEVFLYTYTYEYDEAGRLLSETYVDGTYDGYSYKTSFEYDEQGNIVKWIGYDIDGNYTGVTEYTYIQMDVLNSKVTFTADKLIGQYDDDMYLMPDEPDHPFYQGM